LIHFDLMQGRVQELLHQLRTGELELAIIAPWESVQDTDDLEGMHLYHEGLAIVLPATHPLAEETSLSLQHLREEPFILFKSGYTLRNLVWSACKAAGFEPKVALEVEETDTVRAFVKAGLGVSVLPGTPGSAHDGTRMVAIAGDVIERSIGIAWRKGGSLSGRANRFVEFARGQAETAEVPGNSDNGKSK
jgi:LysR family transcriptional regulator, transcription activator of glutamate synthase operon